MKIKHSKANNPLAKLFAETPSVEAEAEYKKLMIMEEILKLMKEKGINRTQLASGMGVAPSRVTAMMSGSNNFTIETLVRAGRVLGVDLIQGFVPTGQKGHWVTIPETKATTENCIVFDAAAKKLPKAPTPSLKIKKTATRDAEDAA